MVGEETTDNPAQHKTCIWRGRKATKGKESNQTRKHVRGSVYEPVSFSFSANVYKQHKRGNGWISLPFPPLGLAFLSPPPPCRAHHQLCIFGGLLRLAVHGIFRNVGGRARFMHAFWRGRRRPRHVLSRVLIGYIYLATRRRDDPLVSRLVVLGTARAMIAVAAATAAASVTHTHLYTGLKTTHHTTTKIHARARASSMIDVNARNLSTSKNGVVGEGRNTGGNRAAANTRPQKTKTCCVLHYDTYSLKNDPSPFSLLTAT